MEATGVDKIYEIALKTFKQAIEKVNGISIKSENIYKTIDTNLSIETYQLTIKHRQVNINQQQIIMN